MLPFELIKKVSCKQVEILKCFTEYRERKKEQVSKKSKLHNMYRKNTFGISVFIFNTEKGPSYFVLVITCAHYSFLRLTSQTLTQIKLSCIAFLNTSHKFLFSSHFLPLLLLLLLIFSGSSRHPPQQYFTSWFILVLESCDPKYCNWPWMYRLLLCWLALQLPASAYESLHDLSSTTATRPCLRGKEPYIPYLYVYVSLRYLMHWCIRSVFYVCVCVCKFPWLCSFSKGEKKALSPL